MLHDLLILYNKTVMDQMKSLKNQRWFQLSTWQFPSFVITVAIATKAIALHTGTAMHNGNEALAHVCQRIRVALLRSQ